MGFQKWHRLNLIGRQQANSGYQYHLLGTQAMFVRFESESFSLLLNTLCFQHSQSTQSCHQTSRLTLAQTMGLQAIVKVTFKWYWVTLSDQMDYRYHPPASFLAITLEPKAILWPSLRTFQIALHQILTPYCTKQAIALKVFLNWAITRLFRLYSLLLYHARQSYRLWAPACRPMMGTPMSGHEPQCRYRLTATLLTASWPKMLSTMMKER